LVDTEESWVFAHNQDCSNVYKAVGDTFTVRITFKNTGKIEGTWKINITLEDSVWSQVGEPQSLTLISGQTKTLVWNGVITSNATAGSVDRLVVYYNDSFKALHWWIHVLSNAELTIKSSIGE
jgi:hypothetical protein